MSGSVIMALDPGGTTGVAVRMPDDTLMTCTCSTPEELWDLIRTLEPDHVIYETFQAQVISKDGLYTVRLVGGIETICYLFSIAHTKHMPIDRRPFQETAKQLLAGRRTVIHEKDATAHLLRWEHDNKVK